MESISSVVEIRKRLQEFASLVRNHDAVLVFLTQRVPKSDLVTACVNLSDGLIGLHCIEPMGKTTVHGFRVTYGWISPSSLRRQSLFKRK